MVDRRGYGSSPDVGRSDFEIDAADLVDVLETKTAGAHLAGHANGELAALLAAAQRPDLVHSLSLIQPPALRAATKYPAVRQLLERVEHAAVPEGVSVEDYLRASTEGLGMPMPEPTPDRLRSRDIAARTTGLGGVRPVFLLRWAPDAGAFRACCLW